MRKVNALVATAGLGLAFATTAGTVGEFVQGAPKAAEKTAAKLAASSTNAAVPSVDEISSRFFAYAGSINLRSEVTLDGFRGAFGVPVKMRDGFASYGSGDLASGLFYTLRFVPKHGNRESTFRIGFGESSGKDGRLSTLCPMDFTMLKDRLSALGYYETVIPDEIGRIESVRYSRNEIDLWVTPSLVHQHERDSHSTMCVESISMFE